MTANSINSARDAPQGAPPDLTHLRPTTALEMMDRAFGILRIRPGLFFALGCAYAVALAVAEFISMRATTEQSALEAVPWVYIIYLAAQWPFGSMVASAFQSLLFPKRPLRTWVALRGTFGRLPYLILTLILMLLTLEMLAFILPQYLVDSAQSDEAIALMGLAGFASKAAALYFFVSWRLIPVTVIVERRAFFDSMARSAQLMRVRFERGLFGDGAFRRFALLALFPVFLLGAGELCGTAVESLFPTQMSGGSPTLFSQVLASLLVFVVSLIYAPWAAAASVLLYAECRMRSEALDFQVRMLGTDASEIADIRSQISE